MRIVITGSAGLIGTALCRRLQRDHHDITRLVRRTPRPGEAKWDPDNGAIDAAALVGADAVVHLAGAGIGDHRWTAEYKRTLVDSRVVGTQLLAKTLAEMDKPPSVFVSASAVGWYGASGDQVLDERSPGGTDFLADLCAQWEASTKAASDAGIRTAQIRTGIVLSADGGALRKQLPLFKFGLGGKFGNGKQWQSWISIEDEVAAIQHVINSDISGPVNLTAPNPVTNAQFTTTLGSVLRRPTLLPVPKFAPRLLLGAELADALLFTGQRVVPTKLIESGFTFAHPSLDGALRAALSRDAQ